MPSWNIHLAVAKKVNEKFKFEKDSFYIGNLIADVNFNPKLKRSVTHFNTFICKDCPEEFLPNIKEFLKIYKNNIKDSVLLLGYYSHLLTDYFFNNYIFTNCWIQKDNKIVGLKFNNGKCFYNNDIKVLKDYKHKDLESYGKYLFKNNFVELPKCFSKNNDLDLLQDKFFTYKDTIDRIDYLNTDFIKESKCTFKEKIFGLNYHILTKLELDMLFDDCVKYVIDNIKTIIN